MDRSAEHSAQGDGTDAGGRALVAAITTGTIAARLGVRHSTASNWLKRGVPRGERHRVAQLAEELKISVPAGFLPGLLAASTGGAP